MAIDNALAGIAVKDFAKAKPWYERLLDQPSDPLPPEMKDLAEWRFARGGCLQLFKDNERAGRSSVTLAVSDLAGQLTALRAMGVRIGKTSETPAVKTAIVNDDEGNQIVFAQALGDAVAR